MHLIHLCLVQVSDAAAAVYNKIVPSAEAKESEARQHLHRAGDAAEHAGQDLKTSAHEVKEAIGDSARSYGRAAQDRCHPAQAVLIKRVLHSLQFLLFSQSNCLNSSVSQLSG